MGSMTRHPAIMVSKFRSETLLLALPKYPSKRILGWRGTAPEAKESPNVCGIEVMRRRDPCRSRRVIETRRWTVERAGATSSSNQRLDRCPRASIGQNSSGTSKSTSSFDIFSNP